MKKQDRKFVIGRYCLERGFILDDGTINLCTNLSCTCNIIRELIIKDLKNVP